MKFNPAEMNSRPPLVAVTTEEPPRIELDKRGRANAQTMRAQVKEIRYEPTTGQFVTRLTEWPLALMRPLPDGKSPEDYLYSYYHKRSPAGREAAQVVRLPNRVVSID